MTKQERARLRELALAATPGEWKWVGVYLEAQDATVIDPTVNCGAYCYGELGMTTGDEAYIAAANPATLLALLDRIDELEGDAEPDYWVASDGIQVEFGMRKPGLEDDGANWCARTEVNDHINERMTDQPGLILHLEPLYRRPPTERAVPEGWKLVPVEPTFEMLTAADTESVNKNGVMAMTRAYKAMLAAAPGAGGGE